MPTPWAATSFMAAILEHPVRPAVSRAHNGLSRQRHKLAVLFILSYALDFRGSEGGSAVQYLMAGLNTTAFLLLAASHSVTLPRRGFVAFVLWSWLAFLVTGSVGAAISAVPLGQYIRVVYPFTLFLAGFLTALWTAKSLRGAEIVVSAMLAAAVVSLFFTLWWGFSFTGKGADTIRYEILSPLIPLLVVVAGYDLFFARKQQLRAVVLLSLALGVIVLSVTRSAVLVIGFVTGAVLLAALATSVRSARVPRPLLRAMMLGISVTVVGLALVLLLYPETAGRWEHRALDATRNVTFWTRVAAVVGQFQALAANPSSWFVGQGFGASYPWPVAEFPWILPFLREGAGEPVWFPGEFMWMPFLFYGGVVCGPVVAIALVVGVARSFRALKLLLAVQAWRISEARPAWIGAMGYLAFVGAGFTANPFISRLPALFMGLCLGLALAQPVAVSRSGVFINTMTKR